MRANMVTPHQAQFLLDGLSYIETPSPVENELMELSGIRGRTHSGADWAQLLRCKVLPDGVGTSTSNNYGQINFPKGSELFRELRNAGVLRVMCHHLPFRAQDEYIDQTLQVSHTCGAKRCYRHDHLVQESSVDNNNRIGCRGVLLLVWDKTIYQEVDCGHRPNCSLASIVKLNGPIQFRSPRPFLSRFGN